MTKQKKNPHQVDRILKAKSNVTIKTLQRAAELVGRKLRNSKNRNSMACQCRSPRTSSLAVAQPRQGPVILAIQVAGPFWLCPAFAFVPV